MHTTRIIATLGLVAAMDPAFAVAVTSTDTAAVTITFAKPIFADLPGANSDVVSISFPSTGGSTRSRSVNAGRFVGQATDLAGVGPEVFVDGVDNVFLYCYDIYQDIAAGDMVRYEIQFDGATARTLQFLGAVNTVMNDGREAAMWDPYAWVRPLTGLQGAAIQLGIWESLYDDGASWSLRAGTFRAAGLDTATAHWVDRFFSAVDPLGSLDQRFTMVLRNDRKQDMITADPPGSVPEPGTLLLIGTALTTLLATRRRRPGTGPT
ncbi:MAG TPA: PEP-CTERM sorting domain-containing protein [Rhodocyclaceae bacterium]|nr:PEP-CTERM sorting domain-containing protein [Rhodocyclaceae bacterium]